MKTGDFMVRPIKTVEIEEVSKLLASAYHEDQFFKWCVAREEARHQVVAQYYQVYLRSKGCVAHVAQGDDQRIVGATVWLPHETDARLYEEIERVVGVANAPMFNEVAEKSHANEPTQGPFYQLVGFGVLTGMQGKGVGQALLKYHLDILDEAGVPTYLEASTPYHGGGVYGKFGYEPFGSLMFFTETAVLYPLYRHAKKGDNNENEKENSIYL
ncbi:MAG: GNAT family N-acetyltransferase [Defluviitaleaceae bacterium]|nr:GNAT family N-acetyltransferase [Defluviitaleaceae bacterium]